MRVFESPSNFKTFLSGDGSQKVIIADFFASWCGPCKQIGPRFEVFSKEAYKNNENVVFAKVDITLDMETAVDVFRVEAIPCFIIFQNGTILVSQTISSETGMKEFITSTVDRLISDDVSLKSAEPSAKRGKPKGSRRSASPPTRSRDVSASRKGAASVQPTPTTRTPMETPTGRRSPTAVVGASIAKPQGMKTSTSPQQMVVGPSGPRKVQPATLAPAGKLPAARIAATRGQKTAASIKPTAAATVPGPVTQRVGIKPKRLLEADFWQAVGRKRGELVVVFWSAPWCLPCRKISPTWENLKDNTTAHCVTLCPDDYSSTFLRKVVQLGAIPTFAAYMNGEELRPRYSGSKGDRLSTWLESKMAEINGTTEKDLSTAMNSTRESTAVTVTHGA